MWTCVSTRPGITTRSPASISSDACGPIAVAIESRRSARRGCGALRAARHRQHDPLAGDNQIAHPLRACSIAWPISIDHPICMCHSPFAISNERRFDQAVRLVGGDEDLVAVLEAEAREIDRQVMPVRHDEADRGRRPRRCRARPGPSRAACAAPTRCRARRRPRAASWRTACQLGPKSTSSTAVLPGRGQRCREQAIVRFGQRRVLVARKAGERRVATTSGSAGR